MCSYTHLNPQKQHEFIKFTLSCSNSHCTLCTCPNLHHLSLSESQCRLILPLPSQAGSYVLHASSQESDRSDGGIDGAQASLAIAKAHARRNGGDLTCVCIWGILHWVSSRVALSTVIIDLWVRSWIVELDSWGITGPAYMRNWTSCHCQE